MAKRKPKKKPTAGIDFLEPIDLSLIGTKDDPCFGKLYNLSTDECKRCGDSELCGVVFSQAMSKARNKINKKSRFKDIELEADTNPSLTKWVASKKKEGLKRFEIIKLAKKTYGSSRHEIKTIYKKLNEKT